MSKKVEYRYVGTEKMDLLEKARWVTALLDGSHKQGRNSLCHISSKKGADDKRFCCLGVKADVDGVEWEESLFSSTSGNRKFQPVLTGEAYVYYAGIPNDHNNVEIHKANGDIDYASVVGALAHMNDHKWSFKRIAAWIDENL